MIGRFGERSEPDRAAVAQSTQRVAEAFQLMADLRLMVNRLRCSEPDCPPGETVISILVTDQMPHQYTIRKAAGHVARTDALMLAQSIVADPDAR